MSRLTRRDVVDLLLVLGVSLAVRATARVATGFDGLVGQDPFAYYDYAVQLRAALAALHAPPPFFWPIGYPLLVVVGFLIMGVDPLAAQTVSMVAGGLVAPLTYLVVRECRAEARRGALVAGLLTAVSAQLLLASLSTMADASGLAWATLSAWAMLRYTRKGSLPSLALSAFALGWAVLTRWIYATAVLPWALAAVAWWWRVRLPLRRVVAAVAVAVLTGAGVVSVQFVGSPSAGGPSHTGDLRVVSWDPANAVRRTVENSDGTFHFPFPIGLFYALPLLHPAFVPILLTPLLLLGIGSLSTLPRPPALLVAAWPISIYVVLAGIAWENPRFSVALLPPLAVLVGLGWERATGASAGPGWRRAASYLCTAGLLLALAWSGRDVRRLAAAKDAWVATARWAQAQLPTGATLLTFGLTETVSHYTPVTVVELYNEREEDLGALVCGTRTTYLLLDEHNIATQWRGKRPQTNLAWLREHAGLVEVGHHSPFTLWRVGDRCRPSPPSPASEP
ncbi:MAG: ArnT family glycosyltransferase [Acidobacteriota bacterium]